jgi:peptidyl-prolyl cis-trans isomerase A (cyclophilin A)
LFLAFCLVGCAPQNPRVLIETEQGDIRIEVFAQTAPLTAANFLRYVDEGRFAGAFFYRVVTMANQPEDTVRIEVIQGGLGFQENEDRLPPIPHETTAETGILHTDGTLSMARSAPGSASSEFFICIGDQAALDFGGRRNPDGQGFAAFGRVVEGMEVVRAIQQRAVDGQMLRQVVRILNVQRLD